MTLTDQEKQEIDELFEKVEHVIGPLIDMMGALYGKLADSPTVLRGIAQFQRGLVEELERQNFTREEAVSIASNIAPLGGKS